MLHLACELPHKLVVACSGGPDSMALLDYATMTGKREVIACYVNHQTPNAEAGERVVRGFCKKKGIRLEVRNLTYMKDPRRKITLEEWWREERKYILNDIAANEKCLYATGHHLDDVAEWWILSALRGEPHLIPTVNERNIKPLLLTRKAELEDWCTRRDLRYVLDPTNVGGYNSRAKLREGVMSALERIHPGFYTTLANKYRKEV